MFTVKQRDADGIETIYAANKVSVIQRGELFEDGIYLDPEELHNADVKPTADDPMGQRRLLCARDVILFGSEKSSAAKARMGGKVWIMNEAGATVATYDL